MNDKIVTHEDRQMLALLRDNNGPDYAEEGDGRVAALLDRLIAAAEADQPPLPEGWVVLTDDPRGRRPLWHRHGVLYETDFAASETLYGYVSTLRDRLTPLRPTVTEADVEKAARAARAAYFNGPDRWDAALRGDRDDWMKAARAAFKAAEIEVAQ